MSAKKEVDSYKLWFEKESPWKKAVLFPLPLLPANAVVLPKGISKLTLLMAVFSAPGYVKHTSLNKIVFTGKEIFRVFSGEIRGVLIFKRLKILFAALTPSIPAWKRAPNCLSGE